MREFGKKQGPLGCGRRGVHPAFFEFVAQAQPVQQKDDEGVGVDHFRERVKNRRQVFADAGAVRAGAVGAHVAPALRKEVQPDLFAQFGHRGRQRAPQQIGHQGRVGRDGVQQRLFALGRPARQADRHLVRVVGRAVDQGFDAALLFVPIALDDAARVEVRAPSRQAVGLIDVREGVEPLAAPPGVAEGFAFGHKNVPDVRRLRTRQKRLTRLVPCPKD